MTPSAIPPPCQIAVVGAGTTGITAAVLLHRLGHHVTIFERAPQPRAEGCAILLRGVAINALKKSGLGKAALRIETTGVSQTQYCFHSHDGTLRKEVSVDTNDPDKQSFIVRRSDVLNALWEPFKDAIRMGCDRAKFRGGCEVKKVIQSDADCVTLQLANGEKWTGDIILGTDGFRSQIAGYVTGASLHANYLGARIWRGIVQDCSVCTGGKFIMMPSKDGVFGSLMDLGQDENGVSWTHWGMFLDCEYPEDADTRAQLYTQHVPEDVLARMWPEYGRLVRSTPLEDVVHGFGFDNELVQQYVKERVALLGDAAHCMSPSEGWGMASGIMDSVCLAEAFQATGFAGSTMEALKCYEKERMPVTQGYQKSSRYFAVKNKKRDFLKN